MRVRKITAVLSVDEMGACLEFWVDRLGFEQTIAVPDGDKLGFVALSNGAVEIMCQTFESRLKDIPALGQDVRKGPTSGPSHKFIVDCSPVNSERRQSKSRMSLFCRHI